MKRTCEATQEKEVECKVVRVFENNNDAQVVPLPKSQARPGAYPLYNWPGTPLSIGSLLTTPNGEFPVICSRRRGGRLLNYPIDLFSTVRIVRVEAAVMQIIVPLEFHHLPNSTRCPRGSYAYKVQLTPVCETDREFIGARSILVHFFDGSTAVVSFYRVSRIGGKRPVRLDRAPSEEAEMDLCVLHMRAETCAQEAEDARKNKAKKAKK